jgi:hypothetical protein
MSYIGNTPAEKYSSFTKQDFSTSATTSYTLSQSVANENEIALFINFVRQEPTTAYTASGTSLTLTSATSGSDDMYCVYLGKAVQTVNPPSGSVGASQLASDAVTAAKLNDDIISGQTALASEPADTDEFLVSDAGTLKRIDYSLIKGGGITEADQWRLTADLNSDAQPISSNWERNDSVGFGKIGTGITQSSGYFSFPSTGVYFINFGTTGEVDQDSLALSLYTTTDNSSYTIVAVINLGDYNNYPISSSKDFIFNVTNTTTHKCYLRASSMAGNNNTRLFGSTSENYTQITFIRLGDSV